MTKQRPVSFILGIAFAIALTGCKTIQPPGAELPKNAETTTCVGGFTAITNEIIGTMPSGEIGIGSFIVVFDSNRDINTDPNHGIYLADESISSIELSFDNYGSVKANVTQINAYNDTLSPIKDAVSLDTENGIGSIGGIAPSLGDVNLRLFDETRSSLSSDSIPLKGTVWEKFSKVNSKYQKHAEAITISNLKVHCGDEPPQCPITPVPELSCDRNTQSQDIDGLHDVRDYGANGSDLNDDWEAIQTAINCAYRGDTIYFPEGLYRVSRPLTARAFAMEFEGEPHRSGILQTCPSSDLFSFTDIAGLRMKDLTLGALDPEPDTEPSLVRLDKVRYSRFDNLQLNGSYYGLNLLNSVSNSFYDIKSLSGKIPPFGRLPSKEFGEVTDVESSLCPTWEPLIISCWNRQWINMIYTDTVDNASNANRFYNVQLEGGVDGIRLNHTGNGNGGSFSLYGGVISSFGINDPDGENGRAGKAIEIISNAHPTLISGMHIEGGNVHLISSKGVTMEGSIMVGGEKAKGGELYISSLDSSNNNRNTTVINSVVSNLIEIDANSTRTMLMNVQQGFGKTSKGVIDHGKEKSDTLMINVTGNTALKSKSTLGYGMPNPDVRSNNVRMSIRGTLEEN